MANSVKSTFVNDYSSVSNFVNLSLENAQNFLGQGWNVIYQDATALANLQEANISFDVRELSDWAYNSLSNSEQSIINGINSSLSKIGIGWQIRRQGDYPIFYSKTEIRFQAFRNNQ